MTHAFTLRLPQDIETEPSALEYGRFRIRYTYSRARESRETDDRGQDYLALRVNHERLAFSLCDGVSQSFYGDLAARVLGDLLLDWLWGMKSGFSSPRTFEDSLIQKLESWVDVGTQAVDRYYLTSDIPELVRDVLEQKRDMGSETMFVCGLIITPTRNFSIGQVALAWLGDSRLQIWLDNTEYTHRLEASWSSEQRWSTHSGVKGGLPSCYLDTLVNVDRVIAYSDGLLSVEDLLRDAEEDDLRSYLLALLETPASDDMTYLEISLLPKGLFVDQVKVRPSISAKDRSSGWFQRFREAIVQTKIKNDSEG